MIIVKLLHPKRNFRESKESNKKVWPTHLTTLSKNQLHSHILSSTLQTIQQQGEAQELEHNQNRNFGEAKESNKKVWPTHLTTLSKNQLHSHILSPALQSIQQQGEAQELESHHYALLMNTLGTTPNKHAFVKVDMYEQRTSRLGDGERYA
jgi:hypothetical protein